MLHSASVLQKTADRRMKERARESKRDNWRQQKQSDGYEERLQRCEKSGIKWMASRRRSMSGERVVLNKQWMRDKHEIEG